MPAGLKTGRHGGMVRKRENQTAAFKGEHHSEASYRTPNMSNETLPPRAAHCPLPQRTAALTEEMNENKNYSCSKHSRTSSGLKNWSGKGDESHVWIYWGQRRQSRDELYAKPSLPFLVSSFPCCINNYLHSWSRGGNGFIKGMQIKFVWASQSKGKALTWVSTEPLLFIYFNEKWAARRFVRARGFQPFLGTPLEKGLMQSSRTAVCNYAHYRDQASPTLLQSNSGNNRMNSYF